MFECLQCKRPLLSQNGRCLDQCERNFYPNEDKTVCHYNVDIPRLFVAGVLNADYKGSTVLNSSLVHVFDADTQRERIFAIIEETPSNGNFFVWDHNNSVKRKATQGSTIPYESFEKGWVVFEYKKSESFHSYLKLKVSDGQFESEPSIVGINVVSSYSPEVVALEPLIVRRRAKQTITEDNLKLRDIDNFETIVIRVLDGPDKGRLIVAGKESNSFTIYQLEELQVAYEHTEGRRTENELKSYSNSDQMLFQAGDGFNFINIWFSVMIVDSFKPAPVIIKNRGVRVTQKQRVQITRDLLQAKDLDSSDGDIVYSILPGSHYQSKGSILFVK